MFLSLMKQLEQMRKKPKDLNGYLPPLLKKHNTSLMMTSNANNTPLIFQALKPHNKWCF